MVSSGAAARLEGARTPYELAGELPDEEYRTVFEASGALGERRVLGGDDHGRYRTSPA